MTDAQRTGHENETEVIPALHGQGVPRTQELPVVEPGLTQAASPVVGPDPEPAPAPAPVPAAAPVPAPAPPPPAAGPRPERRRIALVLVTALVLAVALGAVVARSRSTASGPAAGGTSAAAPVALDATITSVDPSGGSGLRQQGDAWRTQTYTTADFGNLKDGVGLLLDLGAPRAVTAVRLDAVGGPISVELRAGDQRGTAPTAYTRVGAAVQASGPTSLSAKDGGRHRYWLIWVTRLAAQDGGYRAVIRAPVAQGPAA